MVGSQSGLRKGRQGLEQWIANPEALRRADDYVLRQLLETDRYDKQLFAKADAVRRQYYGTDVYLRGLIEFTNYCRNQCYYCGIRAGNQELLRYRMTKSEILSCCEEGYSLGFRTFVLQGGEDAYFTKERICDIVSTIHDRFPDCVITLSIGEWSKSSYQAFYEAGARRYLLRHETADASHYRQLHPNAMSCIHRKQCLYTLKEIGFQVGSGFMVGSPFQTVEHLIADLRFLQALEPDMIGIGPFLTHQNTPFAGFPNGSLHLTLRLIALLRLLFPHALIPATTALGTIDPRGRELGLQVGANVVMPNLSPIELRKQYSLYDNKICTGEESAQCCSCLAQRVHSIGYTVVTDIGNVKGK